MLSQTNAMMSPSDSQNQKSHIFVGKTSSSSAKGEWKTYSALSADQLPGTDDSVYCDVLA